MLCSLLGIDVGRFRDRISMPVVSISIVEFATPGFFDNFKSILYGMAGHDMARYALKTRGSMEHLFILITMGDLLGIPILPPYYSLRLLPYVVPQISTWKRRMLRERDLTDALA